MKVVFRADGNSAIGLGHITRCYAIATMLKDQFYCTFAVREADLISIKFIADAEMGIFSLPANPQYEFNELEGCVEDGDIVVLDGYKFNTDYQKGLLGLGVKIVSIDDISLYPYVANAVINHSAGVNLLSYQFASTTKFYAGLEYAILRPEFMQFAKAEKKAKIKVGHLFLNMGGADPINSTKTFLEFITLAKNIEEIHVVLGNAYPFISTLGALIDAFPNRIFIHRNLDATSMANLMQMCDLAIVPASSIAMEIIAIGSGLLLCTTADNQINIYNGLIEENAAFALGSFNQITQKHLVNLLENISLLEINNQISTQSKLIDGKSDERILTVFKELYHGETV